MIFGVSSTKEAPIAKIVAELRQGGTSGVYIFSEEGCTPADEGSSVRRSLVGDCVGVSVRGGDCSHFGVEGEAAVVTGEVYGAEGLEYFARDILKAVENGHITDLMRRAKAEVATLLFREGRVVAVSDGLGRRTLYYGLGEGFVVFSNRKRVVEAVGVEPRLVPAGSMVFASEGKIRNIETWYRIPESYEKSLSFEEAVEGVSLALRKAVLERSSGKICVLFSGGLDSTIIASVLRESGVKCRLYCSGFEGSKDVENAVSTGEEIGLEVKVKYISEEELLDVLPIVVKAFGRNTLNVELSIPIFLALSAARRDGCEYAINGTGADELFGGYSRFVSALNEGDYEALHSTLIYYLNMLPERDLAREEEVAGSVGISLRRPFLDVDLVEYAVRIPPQYKIAKTREGCIRKYILRRVAERFNVPRSAIERKKIALQYGSGVDKALRRIARRKGFTKREAKGKGFRGELEYFLEAIKLKVTAQS
ncbi:MAG: asparagine synthase-related protein [Candidatus Jordarchaeales archaeon]